MKNWTTKEEQTLMNYIESSDAKTSAERIEFAHYMMYSKEEGGHPDLKERSLKACISRFYKICERIKNERSKNERQRQVRIKHMNLLIYNDYKLTAHRKKFIKNFVAIKIMVIFINNN